MRPYSPRDAAHVAAMARKFHALVAPPWPLDEGALSRVLLSLPFVRVTDDGFIAGALMDNPISPGWAVAKEFLWWADGSGPALMREFRKWARDQGAREIQWSCPPDARAAALFKRIGQPVESVFSEVF